MHFLCQKVEGLFSLDRGPARETTVTTIPGDVEKKFSFYWNLEADFIEPLNHRRGGWSGLKIAEQLQPDGVRRRICVKKQENHIRRSLLHPFKGVLTIENEVTIISYCQIGRASCRERV